MELNENREDAAYKRDSSSLNSPAMVGAARSGVGEREEAVKEST
jgi:hypothetical protein